MGRHIRVVVEPLVGRPMGRRRLGLGQLELERRLELEHTLELGLGLERKLELERKVVLGLELEHRLELELGRKLGLVVVVGHTSGKYESY